MRDQPDKVKPLPAIRKPIKQQRNKHQESQGAIKQTKIKTLPTKTQLFPLLENEHRKSNEIEKQRDKLPESLLKLPKNSERKTQLDSASKINHEENQKQVICCYQDNLQAYLIEIDEQFLVRLGKRKNPELLAAGVDFIRQVSNDINLKRETVLASTYFWHKLYHEFSKTDAELERYIAACLWIACKLEEYHFIHSSKMCNFWHTFCYNKYDCKFRCKLTPDELNNKELDVLVFFNFKVFTPSFISLFHLFEASIFPKRNVSCSRLAVSLLEASYYRAEIFTYSQASLATGALFKLCQDRDEEQMPAIEAYLNTNKLLNLVSPSTIAGFMTKSEEIRIKKLKTSNLNNFILTSVF